MKTDAQFEAWIIYRVGQKSLTNFKIQLKIINCQEKWETNFILWIHTQSFFIHSAHFNVGTLCHMENI
jgi:hypothetical protein